MPRTAPARKMGRYALLAKLAAQPYTQSQKGSKHTEGCKCACTSAPLPVELKSQHNSASQLEPQQIHKMLEAVEDHVVPLTDAGTKKGHRVYGAAILRKSDLSVVVVGTNEAADCTLWHGEVSTIRNYYQLPVEQRVPAKDCYFVSTHEPCPMCLAAITWAGYDNIYFLHSYEDTRDLFNMPFDLEMLAQVFGCPDGAYRKKNSFWTAASIGEVVAGFEEPDRKQLETRIAALKEEYVRLGKQHEEAAKQAESQIIM